MVLDKYHREKQNLHSALLQGYPVSYSDSDYGIDRGNQAVNGEVAHTFAVIKISFSKFEKTMLIPCI